MAPLPPPPAGPDGPGAAAPAPGATSLAQRLRQATQAQHTAVERGALMQALLRGQMPRAAYVGLLRDLHPVYQALETELARHAARPGLAALPLADLARAAAIARDLDQLWPAGDWAAEPPSPPAQAYADHLAQLSQSQPLLLAAHAYVRYLGDLAGGQVLARIVARSLGLAPGEAVAFYAFGSADTVAGLAAQVRAVLNAIGQTPHEAQALVDEACAAFERHIDWFDWRARQG